MAAFRLPEIFGLISRILRLDSKVFGSNFLHHVIGWPMIRSIWRFVAFLLFVSLSFFFWNQTFGINFPVVRLQGWPFPLRRACESVWSELLGVFEVLIGVTGSNRSPRSLLERCGSNRDNDQSSSLLNGLRFTSCKRLEKPFWFLHFLQ